MKRFSTVGHYGVAFFETENQMNHFDSHIPPSSIYYSGLISDLTYKKAIKVAQAHPSAFKYYEYAMMPLFQGKGVCRKGTENPVLALESLKTPTESKEDYPYILIFKVFKF